MRDLVNEYNQNITGELHQGMLYLSSLRRYKDKISFSTSLGAEDQVLTDMICSVDPLIKIFTLDTGRLFQETYDLMQITEINTGLKSRLYFPDAETVEKMVNEKGINLFYESVDNRKLCCHIRKIEPLQRALDGMKVWISGVRKEQSVTRQEFELVEWDESHQIIKLSPLIEWNESQVWEYLNENKIPYNELHR